MRGGALTDLDALRLARLRAVHVEEADDNAIVVALAVRPLRQRAGVRSEEEQQPIDNNRFIKDGDDLIITSPPASENWCHNLLPLAHTWPSRSRETLVFSLRECEASGDVLGLQNR